MMPGWKNRQLKEEEIVSDGCSQQSLVQASAGKDVDIGLGQHHEEGKVNFDAGTGYGNR